MNDARWRRTCVAACCALLLAMAAWPARALDPSQLFEKVSPSIWIVLTYDAAEKSTSLGSAVVIDAGRLITNCHVIAKSKVILLRRANVMYEAKLEHRDQARDLCQLQVENFNAPAVTMRSAKDLKVGERVYAIGNPKGLEVTLSEGLISGLRPLSDSGATGGGTLVQTSAAISAGSSGGGLFDAEGRLVGITTFGWRDAQNLNVALPTDWIAQIRERMQAALATRDRRAASAGGARVSNAAPGLPAPGTAWSYAFVERVFSRQRIEVTVRTLQVDDTVVEETITANAPGAKFERRVVDARAYRFLEFPLGASNALVELSPYLVAVNEGSAPSAAQNADGYPLGGVGLPTWDVSIAVGGWEEITVPAGKFRALRVDVAGRRSAPIGGRTSFAGRFEMKVWYAQEVNRVVRQVHQVWTADGISPTLAADELLELVAYRPPS